MANFNATTGPGYIISGGADTDVLIGGAGMDTLSSGTGATSSS